MKIKTIWTPTLKYFDDRVNAALAEGYQLTRRDLVPAEKPVDYVFYAELVLPDPAPDPEPVEIDAIQALHIVKAACLAHKGPCNDCPMTDWCESLQLGGDPTDWVLPELEG